MRTTLIIDDYVFKEAKRVAIDSGLTLSQLTTMALRDALRRREPPVHRAPVAFPTYGSQPGKDSTPTEISEYRDDGR